MSAITGPRTDPAGGPSPARTPASAATRRLLLAAIIALLVVLFIVDWNPRGWPSPPGSDHIASAPLAPGGSAASFAVDAGIGRVTINTANLGTRLFVAETPAADSQVPRVAVNGDDVVLSFASANGAPPTAGPLPGADPDQLVVTLNSALPWSIALNGGSSSAALNLSGLRLRGLSFGAGVSAISATLPRPAGAVTVQMAGGASSFVVHVPAGVPAQARFVGGAGTASLDGVTTSGIAGGTVLSTPNWSDAAANRYVFDNTAGVSSFTLTAD